MILGYGRTSTANQNAGLEAQDRDLRAAGCEKVWSEQVSSVAQRAQLEALLGFARIGVRFSPLTRSRERRSPSGCRAVGRHARESCDGVVAP
jgi:DNA invertase Pin-like site-specific DNA recombinase